MRTYFVFALEKKVKNIKMRLVPESLAASGVAVFYYIGLSLSLSLDYLSLSRP